MQRIDKGRGLSTVGAGRRLSNWRNIVIALKIPPEPKVHVRKARVRSLPVAFGPPKNRLMCMPDKDRISEVRRLWFERSEISRSETLALLSFHNWLVSQRSWLLSPKPGETYQQLRSDLNGLVKPSQI